MQMLDFQTLYFFNPLPSDKILNWSKLKQSADGNFEFDVNSRKFSKLLENTVGKGEIARHEQFLLFPQCFQKACFPGASKGVIVWEWVNPLPNNPWFFTTMRNRPCKNIAGKGDASYLFLQCFLSFLKQISFFFFSHMSSANAFNLCQSKILFCTYLKSQ